MENKGAADFSDDDFGGRKIVRERLPDAERVRVANGVAERIRELGDAPVDPETGEPTRPMNEWELHQAAASSLVRLVVAQTEAADDVAAAYFAAEEAVAFQGMIALSKMPHGERRNAVVAHELANHLQRTWVAPSMYGADTVECTKQNNRSVRHEIARRVEELVAKQKAKG